MVEGRRRSLSRDSGAWTPDQSSYRTMRRLDPQALHRLGRRLAGLLAEGAARSQSFPSDVLLCGACLVLPGEGRSSPQMLLRPRSAEPVASKGPHDRKLDASRMSHGNTVTHTVNVRSRRGAEARLVSADQTASLVSGVTVTRSWARSPSTNSAAHARSGR